MTFSIRRIDPSKSVLRRPDFDPEKPWIPPSPRPSYVPAFATKTVRRVEKIITERKEAAAPSRRRKRSKPPILLGEVDKSIQKRHQKWARKVTGLKTWDRQPPKPRFSHPFLDLSAVESDGEGGDIQSIASTLDLSEVPDSSPVDLDTSENTSRHHNKVPAKSPRDTQAPRIVVCDLCHLKLSSKTQLLDHRGKKRCKNRTERQVEHICPTCSKKFDTIHNLKKHTKARGH